MKKVLISGSGGALGREILHQGEGCDDYQIFALTSQPEKMTYSANVIPVHNCMLAKITEENEFDYLIHLAFPRNADGRRYAQGIKISLTVFMAR